MICHLHEKKIIGLKLNDELGFMKTNTYCMFTSIFMNNF